MQLVWQRLEGYFGVWLSELWTSFGGLGQRRKTDPKRDQTQHNHTLKQPSTAAKPAAHLIQISSKPTQTHSKVKNSPRKKNTGSALRRAEKSVEKRAEPRVEQRHKEWAKPGQPSHLPKPSSKLPGPQLSQHCGNRWAPHLNPKASPASKLHEHEQQNMIIWSCGAPISLIRMC